MPEVTEGDSATIVAAVYGARVTVWGALGGIALVLGLNAVTIGFQSGGLTFVVSGIAQLLLGTVLLLRTAGWYGKLREFAEEVQNRWSPVAFKDGTSLELKGRM